MRKVGWSIAAVRSRCMRQRRAAGARACARVRGACGARRERHAGRAWRAPHASRDAQAAPSRTRRTTPAARERKACVHAVKRGRRLLVRSLRGPFPLQVRDLDSTKLQVQDFPMEEIIGAYQDSGVFWKGLGV